MPLFKGEVGKFFGFCLFGISNTAIDFVVFNFLLDLSFNHYIANSLSFLVATTNSYLLNKNITFKDKNDMLFKQYSQFVIVNSVSLFVTSLLLFWVSTVHITNNAVLDANIAKIVATAFGVTWNYNFSRFLIFKTLSK